MPGDMIQESSFHVIQLPNMPGFDIELACLPPKTGTSHPLGHEFDDRSIKVPNELGSVWMRVRTDPGGDYVAHATFAGTPRSVQCDTVDVQQDFRFMGIASSLYDLAEDIFCILTVRSGTTTPDADAFWMKRQVKQRPLSALQCS